MIKHSDPPVNPGASRELSGGNWGSPKGDHGSEYQHSNVRPGVERQMFEPASEQISRAVGQEDSECTAEGSQQQTLRKKLADQERSSSAERKPHGGFLFAGVSTDEQQIRDVRASDQQHQSDGGHQNPKRFAEAVADPIQSFAAGSDIQHAILLIGW
jgi:hypothetical protein